MSRCFPFPPPGYTLSRYSEAALIESIKLQKERENDQRTKDRKSEKRDKRKEKKDKKVTQGQMNGEPWHGMKEKLLDDVFKGETESLDRSGVTVELNQPERFHVPTSSSESTENSNNRKRPISPLPSKPQASGKKIIRIPLTKKRSLSDSPTNEEQPCSTSGRLAEPSPDQHGRNPNINLREDTSGAATISQRLHFKTLGGRRSDAVKTTPGATAISQNLDLKAEGDQRSSILYQAEASVAVKTTSGSVLQDKATRKKQKAYTKYAKLIGNWVPPPLEDPSVDDLDWLLNSKKEECHQPQKRQKPTLTCSSSAPVAWPRAHYLPEVDLYMLPYTVPF